MKNSIVLLLALSLSFSVFAQNPDSTYTTTPTKARIDWNYFKSYLTDSKDLVISPVKWSGKEWVAAGLVIGGTVALYQYDMEIRNYFQSKQTDLGVNLSTHAFEPWGSGMYTFPVLGLLYGQGVIWKNERSKKVALMGVKAFALSGILVTIPKMLFNRHRPYHDRDVYGNPVPQPKNWEGPSFPLYNSFPSGHTTTSFAVAAVIASEYKETIWVPILSYTLASSVALSRLYDDKHWSSDVFMGAAFGWAIGKFIHSSSKWKINTTPIITNESAGLYMNYQF